MNADHTRATGLKENCEFYIDGNVQTSADYDNIKVKVDGLINNIAAASYTVSTTSVRRQTRWLVLVVPWGCCGYCGR